jgi:hypothetical protein
MVLTSENAILMFLGAFPFSEFFISDCKGFFYFCAVKFHTEFTEDTEFQKEANKKLCVHCELCVKQNICESVILN